MSFVPAGSYVCALPYSVRVGYALARAGLNEERRALLLGPFAPRPLVAAVVPRDTLSAPRLLAVPAPVHGPSDLGRWLGAVRFGSGPVVDLYTQEWDGMVFAFATDGRRMEGAILSDALGTRTPRRAFSRLVRFLLGG